ncbi:bifunctional methylenetetrahydrofolate dehydrogenase/methenyltetrahydrofolate cyclohydrolase [Alphaproteobacteria bacterium]|nr:bifunctional methylenetetrahydrofolate dehydrogenase/methenyltetrahydrofolate cyclohydrolase [Alphaproteobacteria bacterium]
MKTINGKIIASNLNEELKDKLKILKVKKNIIPTLVVILVGDNPASSIYVKNKKIKAEEIGINSEVKKLDASVTEKKLLKLIHIFNENDKVDGILVQLPLPGHINTNRVIDAILYEKDVDGFNSKNIGLLAQGRPYVIPCTPLGCLKLLKTEIELTGASAIVVGRSTIVGRPMSYLLTNQNSTVTLAHSKTKNLKELCRDKDIIVAATGIPKMIKRDWVKKHSVIIDVGINQILDSNHKKLLVGDVDYFDVFPKVKAITPVPGGVGPMTIHCLLENTLKLALQRRNLNYNF